MCVWVIFRRKFGSVGIYVLTPTSISAQACLSVLVDGRSI